MNIIWCDKPELKIISDNKPHISVRIPMPSDTEAEKSDKKRMPFINKTRLMWDINYLGEQYCFVIPKGFTYDGATIPFGFRWIIGAKGSDEFMIPSCVHDYMCLHHDCIGNDRQLSSMIFRELLIASGVGKFRAWTMFYAVDNFQKLFCGWEK